MIVATLRRNRYFSLRGGSRRLAAGFELFSKEILKGNRRSRAAGRFRDFRGLPGIRPGVSSPEPWNIAKMRQFIVSPSPLCNEIAIFASLVAPRLLARGSRSLPAALEPSSPASL